jgi:hypothetical protein
MVIDQIIVSTLAATLLVFLILFLLGASVGGRPPYSSEDNLAASYREGLSAAARLQRSAQDLEQQIWAEAARHIDAESSGSRPGDQ